VYTALINDYQGSMIKLPDRSLPSCGVDDDSPAGIERNLEVSRMLRGSATPEEVRMIR